MYTDAEVKQAYAKTGAQLLAELNNAGVTFFYRMNKDELVSVWLDRFGHQCGALCTIHGDVRDHSAVRS